MPKIKPPPAKPEPEIEEFTMPEGPVEIVLDPDDNGETTIDLAAPPVAERKPVAAPVVEDDPLKKALEAQRAAEQLQADAQRQLGEVQRQARERELELERERSEREDAQYNSVLTAIAAEQAALEKAEADYAGYSSIGDWANAAKAQTVISRAAARLDRLEDNKQTFEVNKKEKPQTTQPPAPVDFESRIAQMPDTAKSWLRKHPEFINDAALNRKIGAAHSYLVEVEGKAAFSSDYFDALDERFGFKQPLEQEPEPQPQRRSMPVSAPVSRDVPSASGQRQSSKGITLSEDERRIARTSFTAPHLTDAQKEYMYAQNKRKLQQMRANGQYPNREQG